MKRPIYLDYAATTPCDNRVLAEMMPYFNEKFGNSNSLHFYGHEAKDALEKAREKAASLINATPDQVLFTSGSTESNHIAILRGNIGKKVVTTKTEHKSVIDACHMTENAIFMDIMADGLLDLQKLDSALDDDVRLVSVCFLNNETGVIQDIQKIIQICHAKNVLVHTDATQAIGKIPVDVKALDIDFLSASGHKIYGPKGVGILYFNRKHYDTLCKKDANKDVEFGIRAGTIPVALCVGFGEAAHISMVNFDSDFRNISDLSKMLVDGLKKELDEIYINGSPENGYPGILNISFRGCEGESIMAEASRICVSSGSACTSNKLTISHVLAAMNVLPDVAQSSIRISIGRHTTENDIEIAIDDLTTATKKLRSMSPIWDMIQRGEEIEGAFCCLRSKL
jgi:cysteine desulfurase